MAIETAGQKSAKVTKIKTENQATFVLPAGAEEHINKILDYLPMEHLRGLERIRLVDFINDPRLEEHEYPGYGRSAGAISSEGR